MLERIRDPFWAGTQISKLNAKEYYYSSQLPFALLPDGYIRKLPDENTEKKKEPHMTKQNRSRMDK